MDNQFVSSLPGMNQPTSVQPAGQSFSSTNPTTSFKKPSFFKRNWQLLGGLLVLMVVVVGSAAGYYLMQQSQEIRQQASGFSCSGSIPPYLQNTGSCVGKVCSDLTAQSSCNACGCNWSGTTTLDCGSHPNNSIWCNGSAINKCVNGVTKLVETCSSTQKCDVAQGCVSIATPAPLKCDPYHNSGDSWCSSSTTLNKCENGVTVPIKCVSGSTCTNNQCTPVSPTRTQTAPSPTPFYYPPLSTPTPAPRNTSTATSVTDTTTDRQAANTTSTTNTTTTTGTGGTSVTSGTGGAQIYGTDCWQRGSTIGCNIQSGCFIGTYSCASGTIPCRSNDDPAQTKDFEIDVNCGYSYQVDLMCGTELRSYVSYPKTNCSSSPTPTPTGSTPPTTVSYSCNSPCTETSQCQNTSLGGDSRFTCSAEQGNRCRLSTNVTSATCQPASGPMCLSINLANLSNPTAPVTADPRLGDAVQLTCGEVAGVDHYIARAIDPAGVITNLVMTGRVSSSYTVSMSGVYRMQCQICTGADASTCYAYEPLSL